MRRGKIKIAFNSIQATLSGSTGIISALKDASKHPNEYYDERFYGSIIVRNFYKVNKIKGVFSFLSVFFNKLYYGLYYGKITSAPRGSQNK